MANTFNNAFADCTDGTQQTVATGNTNGTIVIQLDICNKHVSDDMTVDVGIYDDSASVEYQYLNNVIIPQGSTLQSIAGQKLVLLQDDLIKVTPTGANCSVIVGLLDDVNL